MKKVVLSVVTLFSLLLTIFVFPPSATACPVKSPETLLSLYRNSDAIYIGRYNGSESGKVTRDDDDYKETEVKKHFDITDVLKGNPLKEFTLYDSDFEYKRQKAGFETMEQVEEAQVVPEATIEAGEEIEEELPRELKPGDDVLLFLRNDEESKRLELTDYRDGIKKLPIADIAVYKARITELSPLLAAEKPDVDKIVDWLVRCAEDTATRWEGTYELEQSFNALEYKARGEAERKAKIKKGESVDDEPDTDYFNESLDTGRTTVFASSLNEYHKQTLANLLLNGEFQKTPKKPGQPGFIRGDSELMSLVSRWGGNRIAELFLSQLRGGYYTAYEKLELMQRVASILEDEKLTSISEKFSDVAYDKDDAEVNASELEEAEEKEDEEDAADVENTNERANAISTNAVTAEPVVEKAETESVEKSEADTAKKPVVTYKEFRDQLTLKFLLRAQEVIANPADRNVGEKKKERPTVRPL